MDPHPANLPVQHSPSSAAGLPFAAVKAQQVGGSWQRVACPFDSSKSLLPVTCGRLKVPENYQDPQGRSIEIAFMVVKAPRNVDPEHPLIYLNGGPGGTSLIDAEMLVTRPGVHQLVVGRDRVFSSPWASMSKRRVDVENTHVYYDGPQLVFTGELDASQSGPAGYEIAMLYANARNVVFRNGQPGQVSISDSNTSKDYNLYWLCAAGLARQFLADPQQKLDTRCAETRQFRLAP